ncbi:MAG: T9SS type A sorting domain-containing protein [Bacteroidales bacterium]|nr:T9SS type A sorting domain-containing protein [Bacteroidales bacterium]
MYKQKFISVLIITLSFLISHLAAQSDLSINKKQDNNPQIFSQIEKQKGALCVPEYSTGCSMGDGFTDFAVEEIQNYGSGCEDNMGYDGWSQYLGLGPAFLIPGYTHDFIMQTGYDDQYVTIWIDFNDDFVLSEDEKILIDFIMDEASQFYIASVTIPVGAITGLHIMRARTNWQNSCSDPCEGYTYGEAEDYNVIIGQATFGSLEGIVTELAGGAPVNGAAISIDGTYQYSTVSGADGTYLIENILVGEYIVECFKEGYNVILDTITIEENIISIIDFQLTHPNINVNPLSISITLALNSTGEETITIENTGNGLLQWSASTQILNDDQKNFMDLQFEYPVGGSGGEAGIETDGNYIYTTKWNGNYFYQYEIDGTYIGSFTINGAAVIRDLAFDGTHFFGGAATPTVFEMDFENQILVSTITAPTNVRAIAYNDNEDVFYANNWDSPVIKFDKTGANIGEFAVGPVGGSYYGFAYDNATLGGPYLWGYAQIGNSDNEIIQIQLPSGTETGFTLDVASKLSGQVWGDAGGLFTHPNLVFGKWTLGGMVQNEWLWGLELTDAQTWIGVYPNGGSLEGGENEEIIVAFDATDLLPEIYEAGIHFTTYPNVGSPVVDVIMTVVEMYYPCNLQAEINCTNISLQWEMCPPGCTPADSYNIYRNGEMIVNAPEMNYTDSLLFPDSTYGYEITAIYGGDESFPSPLEEVYVPLPDSLEPLNLYCIVDYPNEFDVTLWWDEPDACLTPDGYNIYRDGYKINSELVTELTYVDPYICYPPCFIEYHVKAVYYFGESGSSNSTYAIITNSTKQEFIECQIFPNPAQDKLFIQSLTKIYRIELFNNSGLTILTEKINSDAYQLNVSHLDPGLYFLKLKTEQGLVLRKIVIE